MSLSKMDSAEDRSKQGEGGLSAGQTLNLYSEMSLCVGQFALRSLWINSVLQKSAKRWITCRDSRNSQMEDVDTEPWGLHGDTSTHVKA